MPDDALPDLVSDPNCDLCEAARITPWFHEDDICWIAECEICAVPMVVWRSHGVAPPTDQLAHMHDRLATTPTRGRRAASSGTVSSGGLDAPVTLDAEQPSTVAPAVIRVLDGEGF